MPRTIEMMPVDELGRIRPSKGQRALLASIRRLEAKRGFPPTIRELASDLGVSTTNGVAQTLDALRRKGWVTWDRGHSRTLKIVD